MVSPDDERQINRLKGIASRFKDKLIKIIENINDKFDEYSISHKIRQTSLHWSYKLVEVICDGFFLY